MAPVIALRIHIANRDKVVVLLRKIHGKAISCASVYSQYCSGTLHDVRF